MGGYIVRFTLNLKIWHNTDISLYFPISWPFQMGSHWPHWKAKSSLWALAVLNGGVYHKIYPKSENVVSHWHFLIFPISWLFRLSLTALKSEEFTLSSGSFKWRGLIIRFTLNLKIWAPRRLGVLINKVFLLYVKTNKCNIGLSQKCHVSQ